MAEVFIPHPSVPGMDHPNNRDVSGCASSAIDPPDPQEGVKPLDETFVFPAPSPLNSSSASYQAAIANAASSFSSTSTRPNTHRHKPSNLSLGMLTHFQSDSTNLQHAMRPFPSPTRSPARLTPPSGHSTGHRRGGSEFVGGDISHGGPVLVNTAEGDEGTAPAPPSPGKGPPAGRRGHSHRRSHAISQSDVSNIMHPAKDHITASDPSTPSDPAFHPRPSGPQRSNSHPSQSSTTEGGSHPPSSRDNSALAGPRSRVGFSDSLEYIARPLSTISSETSSSMSTVRANHSLSDSVSSIVSGRTSSPSALRSLGTADAPATSLTPGSRSVQTADSPTRRRASTSRSITEMGSTSEEPSDPTRPHLPVESAPPLDENFDVPECTPMTGADFVFPHADSQPGEEIPSPGESLKQPLSFDSSPPLRPRTSPESKCSSKQQRVKSWAETILHRKEKQVANPMRETVTQTPSHPCETKNALTQFSLDNITFDDDTTLIIEEPTARGSSQPPVGNGQVHPAESLPLSPDVSQASPMIDLDAALGPSSSSYSEVNNEYFGKLATGKRRLHSSGETGGFVGPGMHYHRRAESAPEMEPLERSRFGFPRLGSNPAMEEAIAEEDEDQIRDNSHDEGQDLGLGVNVVEAEAMTSEPMRRPSTRPAPRGERRVIRRIATPPDPFAQHDTVEIVDSEEEPRFSTVTKSSDESSITPTVSPDPLAARPASAPLESAMQTPSLTYGTTPETPSAVSSADYSKTSFDVRDPRLHTARSSLTDRATLSSSKAGDFSASSVDDVPSLTSSSSTMMSGLPPRFSGSGQVAGPADRSVSLSAAVPYRSRPGTSSKRASLASLSKLMGGPYNKSRLNIAETLPPDTPEKSEKKRHRISRMMRFWKSKEKLST